MKTKAWAGVCVVALGLTGVTPACVGGTPSPEAVVADAILARPACLVATAIGSVFFVVALPFAATSKSVNKAADALVVKPAQATFTRPLGDFGELRW